jgi:hypothetical protein
MKKVSSIVLGLGLVLSGVTGCGKDQPPTLNQVNPFPQAQANGQIPAENPRGTGSEGPIDGKWDRTATRCLSGKTRSDITEFAFHIDGTSGSVVLVFPDGNLNQGTWIATIPVTFAYTPSDSSKGKVQIQKDSSKKTTCLTATNNNCPSHFSLPDVGTIAASYTLSTDKSVLSLDMNADLFCTNSASSTADFKIAQ